MALIKRIFVFILLVHVFHISFSQERHLRFKTVLNSPFSNERVYLLDSVLYNDTRNIMPIGLTTSLDMNSLISLDFTYAFIGLPIRLDYQKFEKKYSDDYIKEISSFGSWYSKWVRGPYLSHVKHLFMPGISLFKRTKKYELEASLPLGFYVGSMHDTTYMLLKEKNTNKISRHEYIFEASPNVALTPTLRVTRYFDIGKYRLGIALNSSGNMLFTKHSYHIKIYEWTNDNLVEDYVVVRKNFISTLSLGWGVVFDVPLRDKSE